MQCLGKGTYTDIPPHLQAAVRVLSLRFFDASDNELQPFDRLAFESVLYQIFLTSTVHCELPTVLQTTRGSTTDFLSMLRVGHGTFIGF